MKGYRFKVELIVDYDLNEEDPAVLRQYLEGAIQYLMDNGLLTHDSPATVDGISTDISGIDL
jgi:hypothetical protein